MAHEFDHADSVSYTVEAASPERVHIVTSTEDSESQLPGIQVTASSDDSRTVELRSSDGRKKVALASDSAPTEIDGLRLRVLHAPPSETEDALSGVKVRAGDRQAIIEKIASHYHARRRKTRRRRRKHFKRKRQFRQRGEGERRRRHRPQPTPASD